MKDNVNFNNERNCKMKEYICCICNKKITGYGNNPDPIRKNGRCCDDCNKLVIKARLLMIEINRSQWKGEF